MDGALKNLSFLFAIVRMAAMRNAWPMEKTCVVVNAKLWYNNGKYMQFMD
jgi:hypothetical protein